MREMYKIYGYYNGQRKYLGNNYEPIYTTFWQTVASVMVLADSGRTYEIETPTSVYIIKGNTMQAVQVTTFRCDHYPEPSGTSYCNACASE